MIGDHQFIAIERPTHLPGPIFFRWNPLVLRTVASFEVTTVGEFSPGESTAEKCIYLLRAISSVELPSLFNFVQRMNS